MSNKKVTQQLSKATTTIKPNPKKVYWFSISKVDGDSSKLICPGWKVAHWQAVFDADPIVAEYSFEEF